MLHLLRTSTTVPPVKSLVDLFDFALRLQGPRIALGYEIGVAQMVVAVVHHIRLEAGVGYILDIDRHEGEVGAELVAARTLLNLLHEEVISRSAASYSSTFISTSFSCSFRIALMLLLS